MTFTGTCRITAVILVVGSVLVMATNVFFMFEIDGDAARIEFFQKAISKNTYPLLIGIALGTLADISRAVQLKSS